MTGILTITSGQFHKEEVTAHSPLYCFRKIPVCCPLVQDTFLNLKKYNDMYWPAYNDMYWPAYNDIMPALSKFQPILDITSYLFYNMSMATCNLKWAQLFLVTLCARGMQLLNYRVGHLLRFEFEGTEPECAS